MQVIWTPPPIAEVTLPNSTVGPRVTSFLSSGPIVVNSGDIVRGLWVTRTSGTGPCITIANGATNWVIEDCKIGPNSDAADTGTGISGLNNSNGTINNNLFDDIASSFYAVTCTGGIKFHHNYNTRIRGPNFASGGARGQMVQFNACTGPNNKIMYNISDQTSPGYLNGPEDHINLYASTGTAGSPILVKYNKLRGGGPSPSGGGIVAGDHAGAYVTIDSNILINPGQYGVAVSGGNNHQLLNNKVFGQAFPWSNIGMFIWVYQNPALPPEPACFANIITGNRVNWVNSSGAANNFWDPGTCTGTTNNNNVFGDATITAGIWDEVFPVPEEVV